MKRVYRYADLSPLFTEAWQGKDPWEEAGLIQGDIYRQVNGRRTLQFTENGQSFFIKVHEGVGWKEIAKNLLTFRKPIVGARQEYLAINAMQKLGLDTMQVAAYAETGANPATRKSFLITHDLSPADSLETLCQRWPASPPSFQFKRNIIVELAKIASAMHKNGIFHRDFYLCHFLLPQACQPSSLGSPTEKLRLHVIDLHRALIRPFAFRWTRWQIKDLAALYFSTLECGFTRQDYFRFIRCYTGMPLREVFEKRRAFWQKVYRRAMAFQQRESRKRLRALTRKLYSNSADISREDRFDQVVLYKKSISSDALNSFLSDPDQAMSRGTMLKDGDSTTVVRLPLDGQEVVVKRYNIQSLGYLLRRLFRPSRAWYCWRNAHWLQLQGIETGEPLIMIERRWGWLRREAWFVSAWRQGASIQSLIGSLDGNDSRWGLIFRQVRRFLERLHRSRFVHGDMKSSNLLLDGDNLVVLDLDSMRPEWMNSTLHKYSQRDWNRFWANWSQGMPLPRQAVGLKEKTQNR